MKKVYKNFVNNYSKMLFLLVIITFGVLLFILSNPITLQNEIGYFPTNQHQIKIKSTINRIYIDGNFSETAATYWWCNGSGTAGAPYIIENLTIDAENSTDCIYIQNTADYFIIRNCTIINGNNGIVLKQVSNGILKNNSIHDQIYTGIYLTFSNNIRIIINVIHDNGGDGFTSTDSPFVYIENNTIYDNKNNGINIDYSCNNILLGNTIFNNSANGIDLYYSNNTRFLTNNISFNIGNGIYLSHSNNGTITDNFINNNKQNGIYLWYSINISFFNLKIFNNTKHGISLENSENNLIIGNTIHYNGHNYSSGYSGITLYNSGKSTIVGNSIFNNKAIGICLSFSDTCNISRNNVYYNSDGINILATNNSALIGNTIEHNGLDGIYLAFANNNTLLRNNITNNGNIGIKLFDSDSNKIINNSLINNYWGAIDVGPDCEGNIIENNVIQNRENPINGFLIALILIGAAIASVAGFIFYKRRVAPVISLTAEDKSTWIRKALKYSPQFVQKLSVLCKAPRHLKKIEDSELIQFFKKPLTFFSSELLVQIDQTPLLEDEKIEILEALLSLPLAQREQYSDELREYQAGGS